MTPSPRLLDGRGPATSTACDCESCRALERASAGLHAHLGHPEPHSAGALEMVELLRLAEREAQRCKP